MKPVFKCEYCKFMGTEEEVREHEANCYDNYDKRSCLTCKHSSCKNLKQYECARGVDIPEGNIYEACVKYERKEMAQYRGFDNILGGLFGGF